MTLSPTSLEAQQQFEQLFQRSHRRAYRLAYRLTGNATEAEDVTQDAFVRAWNCFDRFDSTRSFEAWLFRILTNRVLDLRRRKKRVRMVALDAPIPGDEGQALAQTFAAPGSDPLEILLHPIMDERLRRAIAALPESHRTTILLYDIEQYSYQEIAAKMHCALGTVRSRIHRGRQMLRRSLEGMPHSLESCLMRQDRFDL